MQREDVPTRDQNSNRWVRVEYLNHWFISVFSMNFHYYYLGKFCQLCKTSQWIFLFVQGTFGSPCFFMDEESPRSNWKGKTMKFMIWKKMKKEKINWNLHIESDIIFIFLRTKHHSIWFQFFLLITRRSLTFFMAGGCWSMPFAI